MRPVAILLSVLLLAGCQSESDPPLFAPFPTPPYAPLPLSQSPPLYVSPNPYATPFQDGQRIGPAGPINLVPPSMRSSDQPGRSSDQPGPPPEQPAPRVRPPYETPEPEIRQPTPSFDRPDPVAPLNPEPVPEDEEKRARMYRELHGDPS